MRLIFKIKLLLYFVISIIIIASFIYGYKKVKSFLDNNIFDNIKSFFNELFTKNSNPSPIIPNQSGGGFNSHGGSSW